MLLATINEEEFVLSDGPVSSELSSICGRLFEIFGGPKEDRGLNFVTWEEPSQDLNRFGSVDDSCNMLGCCRSVNRHSVALSSVVAVSIAAAKIALSWPGIFFVMAKNFL
jgi:hypothetical protein